MKNLQVADLQDKMVKVTMRSLVGQETVFEGKVVDYNMSVIWVEKTDGEWVAVNILNPNINTVEEVGFVVDRHVNKIMDLKEARKTLDKAFKWEDEDIKVYVKIYDCFEDTRGDWDAEQSYDIEITWAFGDEVYTDCLVTDSFCSNMQDDEVSLKQATTRAKAVLRTVKGWYTNYDNITVVDGIEVYHA